MTIPRVNVSEAGDYSLWLEPADPGERMRGGVGEHIISGLGSRMTALALASLLNEALKLAEEEPTLSRARIAHGVAKTLGGHIDPMSFRA